VIVTASRGNTAFAVPLPPPIYWHTRHQQTRAAIGASAAIS
jgi:hypothetical protein